MKKSTRSGGRASPGAGSGADAADIPRRVVRLVQLDVGHREEHEVRQAGPPRRRCGCPGATTASKASSSRGGAGSWPAIAISTVSRARYERLVEQALGNGDAEPVDARARDLHRCGLRSSTTLPCSSVSSSANPSSSSLRRTMQLEVDVRAGPAPSWTGSPRSASSAVTGTAMRWSHLLDRRSGAARRRLRPGDRGSGRARPRSTSPGRSRRATSSMILPRGLDHGRALSLPLGEEIEAADGRTHGVVVEALVDHVERRVHVQRGERLPHRGRRCTLAAGFATSSSDGELLDLVPAGVDQPAAASGSTWRSRSRPCGRSSFPISRVRLAST